MHRSTILCALLIPLILNGCATTGTMVPVEGPLSKMTPVPIIQPYADGIWGNTGNMSLTMPDGEQCKGRWSSAAGAGVAMGTGSLISTYGNVYGTGVSVSTGHGQNPGQAILTCDKGTIIHVEFVTGAGTANGFGFAKDNKGNVYRLIF